MGTFFLILVKAFDNQICGLYHCIGTIFLMRLIERKDISNKNYMSSTKTHHPNKFVFSHDNVPAIDTKSGAWKQSPFAGERDAHSF